MSRGKNVRSADCALRQADGAGSKLVLDYLLARGMPAEKVERVWAPAGLDLGAATPEEIALSIVSQMVALRRGGSAKALKESSASSKNTTAETVIHQCEADSTR